MFQFDAKNPLTWLPIAFASFFIIGLFITFAVAASYDQIMVPPEWPSISSTGAYPPTSCIFTMVLVISGVICYFCVMYMYLYLKVAFKDVVSESYNKAMLICGILVAVGVMIVGCNQRPNIAILHLIGALLAFLVGAAYIGMMSWTTVLIKKKYDSAYPWWFIIMRWTFVGLEILSVILMFSFSAKRAESSHYATLGDLFEWFVAIWQSLFLASYCIEFSNFKNPEVLIQLTHRFKLSKDRYRVGLAN